MASTVFSSTIDSNLETYCLIWVDNSVNSSKNNIDAQQQLRITISHLLTFDDDQQCIQYLHTLSNDDRVILIVSGKLGQILVPQIIHFRQIISIYIYCMNKQIYQQWAKNFSKVFYFYFLSFKLSPSVNIFSCYR
jgi:hypothetical protein